MLEEVHCASWTQKQPTSCMDLYTVDQYSYLPIEVAYDPPARHETKQINPAS